MEKRKWLWKRRPSDKSPGETESSGSVSSYSERCSDEQEVLKESPNHSTQSPEVTSKAAISSDDLNGSVKSLTEKLSAALVNVSAKEDLVKQHAKVAEEAVAGWEKAENEVAVLKQQLESAVQQNLSLEVRVSHLDGALKECVKQLRQAREEQEQRTRQWESTQADLQNCLNDLQNQTQPEFPSSIDSDILLKLEALEKENSSLKLELISRSEELEIMTLERDLSTQTAEIASKQQLESIKKLAKLEAECRKLQATARKSSNNNNNDEQFKNEKTMSRSLTTCSVDIDMMDDFLEMERLAAALPDTKNKTLHIESTVVKEEDNESRVEVEKMSHWVAELEEKLSGLEMEKAQLEADLNECQEFLGESRVRLSEAETEMEELKREITAMNDAKELLEFQLVGVEVEARTLSEDVGSLKVEVEKEKGLSEELKAKCRELEEELMRKNQEAERQVAANTIVEQKVKQEDLAIAASKLADCQKTIASLGRQLKSLATLEDFLIDTANLPGFSSEEEWKLHSNDSYIQKTDFDQSKAPTVEDSPTPLPENHRGAGSLKGRNGFSVLFSRGKTGDST